MGLLRILLAFTVVLGHANARHFHILENDGGLAVIVFFMISGFYMALIADKYGLAELTVSKIKNFYMSRFLRIYPVVWVCTALTLLLKYFGAIKMGYWPGTALALLYAWQDKVFYCIENIFLFGQGFGRFIVFDPALHQFIFEPRPAELAPGPYSGSAFPILGQAWTLSLELTFYLLVPFILTKKARFIATICVLSFLLRHVMQHHGWQNYNLDYAFFPTVLGFFLLGSLSCQLIYRNIMQSKYVKPVAISLLMLVLFFMLRVRIHDHHHETMFIVLVAVAIPFLFAFFKDSKWDNWIGELSFPVYMTHFIFIGIVDRYQIKHASLTVCIGTFILSILLVYLFIRPIDHFRYKRYISKRALLEEDEVSTAAIPQPAQS